MPIQNAKAFYQIMTEDTSFSKPFEADMTYEEHQKLINDAGYEFTAEEWETFREKILAASDANEDGEVSDSELNSINGGSSATPFYEMPLINWEKISFLA